MAIRTEYNGKHWTCNNRNEIVFIQHSVQAVLVPALTNILKPFSNARAIQVLLNEFKLTQRMQVNVGSIQERGLIIYTAWKVKFVLNLVLLTLFLLQNGQQNKIIPIQKGGLSTWTEIP